MSEQTLRNLEKAIEEHYADELTYQSEDKQRGMIVDWVVGYTVHALVDVVDVDGVTRPVSGYANWWTGADTNPNGQAHLAHWVGEEIAMGIGGSAEDDD